MRDGWIQIAATCVWDFRNVLAGCFLALLRPNRHLQDLALAVRIRTLLGHLLAGLPPLWRNYSWSFALCHTPPLTRIEMTLDDAGWRQNRELTPPAAHNEHYVTCGLPDAAGVFMHQRLAFGASERFSKLRHIRNGVVHPVLGN
jgi:hypothetical protein